MGRLRAAKHFFGPTISPTKTSAGHQGSKFLRRTLHRLSWFIVDAALMTNLRQSLSAHSGIFRVAAIPKEILKDRRRPSRRGRM